MLGDRFLLLNESLYILYLQVSVLKAKINEEVGLPAGKQKLQYEVISTSLYITCTSILIFSLLITSYYFLGPPSSKQKLRYEEI